MTLLSLAVHCRSIGRDCHLTQSPSLREAGLKINPKKCKFLQEEVVVLGRVVSREGISTDPEKVRVIKEWPVPVMRVS